MGKKQKKSARYTVEEKMRILEEARQPNTTVAEVLRRYGVDPATFYRWEKRAKQGMREALNGAARKRKSKQGEVERLKRDVERKSRIIAEVVEENLEMKKKRLFTCLRPRGSAHEFVAGVV